MKTLNRFFVGVLLALLVVLLFLWQRSRSRVQLPPVASTTSTMPATVRQPVITPAAREEFQSVLELKNQKKWAQARDALLRWLNDNPKSELAPDAERELGAINIQIVTSQAPAPEKVDYTIQAGDTLDRIARKFNTTVELIQKSHRLSSPIIRPGDRLRIYQAKFSVVVDKTANSLLVFDDGRFFKKYRVGTGEYSTTPAGDFKIRSRIPNPAWYTKEGKTIPFGDTNNVLGTHWLGLDVPGIGIHGTWEPDSIGKSSSAGCVRLLNEDIVELFVLLPYGTPVTIKE